MKYFRFWNRKRIRVLKAMLKQDKDVALEDERFNYQYDNPNDNSEYCPNIQVTYFLFRAKTTVEKGKVRYK